MFLLILFLVLIIQICNLYHYHSTKENLISLAGIIVVSLFTFYDLYTNRHQRRENFNYIKCVQVMIITVSLVFLLYYCRYHSADTKKHILQHLF